MRSPFTLQMLKRRRITNTAVRMMEMMSVMTTKSTAMSVMEMPADACDELAAMFLGNCDVSRLPLTSSFWSWRA